MLGSTVLEIALGLTFLYLALSLVCSALAEYGSGFFRRRGNHLRDAIGFFFNAGDDKGKVLFTAFFNQGLIRGLDPRSWKGLSRRAVKAGDTGAKPTYIPDSTFADVVFELLAKGESLFVTAAPATATSPAAPAQPPAATVRAAVAEAFQNIAGAVAMLPDGVMKAGLRTVVADASALVAPPAGAPAGPVPADDAGRVADAFDRIRRAVAEMPDAEKAPIHGVIAREEEKLRTLRENDAALARLRVEVAATFTTLRGAIALLPNPSDQDKLSKLLGDQEKSLADLAGVAGSSDAAWTRIKAMLDAIAGAVAVLPEGPSKAGLAALLGRETGRLGDVKADVVTAQKIRAAVASLPASEFKNALAPLMDEPGDDLATIKDNLKSWYNDAMERVSGGYKRTTHLILFALALVVACVLNADTAAIADRLAREPALRAAVVARATSQLKRIEDAPAKPADAANHAAIVKAAEGPAVAAKGLDDASAAALARIAAAPDPVKASAKALADKVHAAAVASRTAADLAPKEQDLAKAAESVRVAASQAKDAASSARELVEAIKAQPGNPAADLLDLATRAEAASTAAKTAVGPIVPAADGTPALDPRDVLSDLLGIPLGWPPDELKRVFDFSRLQDQTIHHPIVAKAFGLLLTALALTMGAPFWFDVLNKLVNVRSAGKKPDKTTDAA